MAHCGDQILQVGQRQVDSHIVVAAGGVASRRDAAVGHQNVHLRLAVGVVQTFEQRDAVHVLRLFPGVGQEVGPRGAKAQVHAVAQQAAHLRIDVEAVARHHRQPAGGGQLDDAAVDQHLRAGLGGKAGAGGVQPRAEAGQVGQVLLKLGLGRQHALAHAARGFGQPAGGGVVDAGDQRHLGLRFAHQALGLGARVVLATAAVVHQAGQHIAQLALELQHLRQVHVHRPHRHALLPVALWRQRDALAARRPGIDEAGGIALAHQHAERHLAAAEGRSAMAPDVRVQADARDQAAHRGRLVSEVGRGDLRAQVARPQCHRAAGGQRAGQRQRRQAQAHALDAPGPLRAAGAGVGAQHAHHVFLAAQRLGVRQQHQVPAAPRQRRRRVGHCHLAGCKLADAAGAGRSGAHCGARALHQQGHRQALQRGQQQHAALRVDGQTGAEAELVAAVQRHVQPVHDAGAPGLVGQGHQPAQVTLLGQQIVGAQELAVEVVQPRQRRVGRDQRDALARCGQYQRRAGGEVLQCHISSRGSAQWCGRSRCRPASAARPSAAASGRRSAPPVAAARHWPGGAVWRRAPAAPPRHRR